MRVTYSWIDTTAPVCTRVFKERLGFIDSYKVAISNFLFQANCARNTFFRLIAVVLFSEDTRGRVRFEFINMQLPIARERSILTILSKSQTGSPHQCMDVRTWPNNV